MLTKDSEAATRFLDTLLNQLNWSFSEFIGMMQEVSIQNLFKQCKEVSVFIGMMQEVSIPCL